MYKDYEGEFVNTLNQRAFALIECHLKSEEKSLDFDSCKNGHSSALVQKPSNSCLHKYIFKKLNRNFQETSSKKRKLKTLIDFKVDTNKKIQI